MLSRLRQRFRSRRSSTLTRDHIVWAYRLLLDREPESGAIVAESLRSVGSVSDLRRQMMRSTEFVLKNRALFVFPSERRTAIALLPDGLRLFVDLSDAEIGFQILLGAFEPHETRYLRELVQPGQTVLDLGANIGYFSMLLAQRVGPAGRVIAYEPLPQNHQLLARSIRENGFEDRISLRPAAVGEAAGELGLVWLPLERGSMNSGGSYLLTGGGSAPPGHELETVPVVAIDSEAIEGPVHFIKIDVEGAELLAFRGARATLERDRPTVLAEINPTQLPKVSGCTPTGLLDYMAELGYTCRVLGESLAETPVTSLPDSGPILSVVFSPR